MYGLTFEEQAPLRASHPQRTDIACFVGFVRRSAAPLPLALVHWLREHGWLAMSATTSDLLNLPVPLDSWNVFNLLFDWQTRPLQPAATGEQTISTYLGAAVRSFFAQGGRKCFVVRVGDPWPYSEAPDTRAARIDERLHALLPGYPNIITASPVERTSWLGVGQLFGLPEVSFLCLPDLADIVRTPQTVVEPPAVLPPGPEVFVECSASEPPPPVDDPARFVQGPRCDEAGYQAWAQALHRCAELIARQQREVQLIAAIPIPVADSAAAQDLLADLVDGGHGPLAQLLLTGGGVAGADRALASAFVQLVYPWARTPGSVRLPEQLESPDAVLAGLLARNALTRGTFRSAANLHLADLYDLFPVLPRAQLLTPVATTPGLAGRAHTALERLTLFGPTPTGLRLLSDVTTSLDESYRQAGVNRLVAALIRTARLLGETVVFESSNERLWARLRTGLEDLLNDFLQAGALQGPTAREAFSVHCDRSTMSQQDIDNGRVIAEISFRAAATIEQITVSLALDEGGQVALLQSG